MSRLFLNFILIFHLILFLPLFDRIYKKETFVFKILIGLFFSGIIILVMTFPFVMEKGLFYDTRSIVMGFAGFYGGLISFLITGFFAITYRAIIGGNGVVAGILTIILTGLCGLIFRLFYHKKIFYFDFKRNLILSLLFSLSLSILMLFSQLFILPLFSGFQRMGRIYFYVLTLYPLTSTISFMITNYILKINRKMLNAEQMISFQSDILNNSNIIFVELDKSGKILNMNKESENVTGYSVGEIIGKDWTEIFITDDYKDKIIDILNDLPKNEKLFETFENQIKTKNGDLKYILWKNKILRKGKDEFSIISFGIDVTEKKKLEEKLKESEELFRKSFKEHNTINLLIDYEDGTIVDCNEAAVKFYGYSEDELKSMKISDINTLPVEEVKKEMEYAKLLRKNHFDFKHRLKNGKIRDVEVFSKGIKYKGKDILHSIIFDVTEKKEYERNVIESKEYLKTLIDSLNDALFIIDDENFNIVDVNKKTCEMFGYTYDEILKLNFGDFNHKEGPYSRNILLDHLTEVREKGYKIFESFAKKKSGELFSVEFSIRYLKIMGSNRYLVLVRDITERREKEKELREFKEKIDLILSEEGYNFWDWDIKTGKIHFTSNILNDRKFKKVYSSMEWFERIHPDDYKNLMNTYDMCLTGIVDKYNVELRVKNYNGEYKWFMELGKIFEFDERKRPLRINGLHIEITRLKKLNEELEKNQEFFKSIFNNTPDAIFLLKNDIIIDCNKVAEKMFDLSKREMVGKTPYHFSPPFQNDGSNSEETAKFHIEKCLKKGRENFNWTHRKSDGTSFECEIYLSIFDEKKNLILAFIRDIEEKVKREKELQILKKRLEQSQRLETFGKFAGGIAHDFNNVLNVIIAQSEYLLESVEKDSKYLDSINEILKVSLSASNFTKKLLSFSKGSLTDPEVISLNSFLKDFYPVMKKLAGENIEIMLKLDDGIKNIFIDKTSLDQILINLVSNSKDAIESIGSKGKIVIETKEVYLNEEYIKKYYKVDEGEYIILLFSDNGCGIDPENFDKIFDPFFSTKGEKGTGLGLSIVYGIVKQFKGHMTLYSEKNLGTTFKIYLPVTEKRKEKKNDIINKKITFKSSGKKILLVEDDDSLRNILYNILVKNKFEVVGAKSADEGLKSFKNDIFSLVISDMVLPDKTGIELFKEFKKIKTDFKIILISGYTEENFIDDDIRGIPFLNKPFRTSDLLLKISEVLR